MKLGPLFGLVLVAVIGWSPLQAQTELSNRARILLSLYEELHRFKDDPEFHEVGFGVCCRFNQWLVDVDQLAQETGVDLLSEIGFIPGELRQLGMAYLASRGEPTSFSEWMEATIAAGQL